MHGRIIRMALTAAWVGATAVQLPAQSGNPLPQGAERAARNVSERERLDALSRAQVWSAPVVPVSKARMAGEPSQPRFIECRFKITELGGTAPKFDCVLGNGDQIRVKYGRSPEIPSEVAAARLLHSLGFGADNVMLVERLRCHGCPAQPFLAMRAVDITGARPVYEKLVDYTDHKDFEWVAVERKHPGRPISTDQVKGWAFFELERIDAGRGGAPRAHVDALRLMAVFLAHWDNKSENQRLVCLPDDQNGHEGGACPKPFAMLQDVGSAFGPPKIDLDAWRKTPIWANRRSCTVSMEHLPAGGATFAPVAITDAGRRLLASLLGQLADRQLTDLFTGARFDKMKALLPSRPTAVWEWVRVFKLKVREITDGPACPQ
jgi:hypothetical protein